MNFLSQDEIERQIMMEMEQEVERQQMIKSTTASQNPASLPEMRFNPSTSAECTGDVVEQIDAIQASIERRIKQKRDERLRRESHSHVDPSHHSATTVSIDDYFSLSTEPAEQLPAKLPSTNRDQPQITFVPSNDLPSDNADLRRYIQSTNGDDIPDTDSVARPEAPEKAQHEAEAQARREAEEQARREAEAQARREAEEHARREAEAQARREAEEHARCEAEAQARREAEEQARREAEEHARREAEAQARREAEEQARREHEAQARREAEEQARREHEAHQAKLEEIRREVAERVRKEVEEKYRREAEERRRAMGLDLSGSAEIGRDAVLLDTITQTASTAGDCVTTTVGVSVCADSMEQSNMDGEGDSISIGKAAPGSMAPLHTVDHLDHAASDAGDVGNRVETPEYASSGSSATTENEEDGSSVATDAYGSSHADQSAVASNGMFSADEGREFSSAELSDSPPWKCFEEELEMELRDRGEPPQLANRHRVEMHRYETIREPGRCLYPPAEVGGALQPHVQIQLGFFRAKQAILTYVPNKKVQIAQRETTDDTSRRPLSRLQCYFESTALLDPELTVESSEELPLNDAAECLLQEYELNKAPLQAVRRATSRLSYGDVIQTWEHAAGRPVLEKKSQKLNGGTAATDPGDGMCYGLAGSSASQIWVKDIDTRKPIHPQRVFSGGTLIQVDCVRLSSPMAKIHGESQDPLIVAAAFYFISSSAAKKVSETFYFDSAVDIFYPQKQRQEINRISKAVAFIPAEFRGSLHFVVRAYRQASEDFENYMDLYTRPDRYKAQHVAPMKQETLLLAMASDVLEEIGWNSVECDKDQKIIDTITMDRVYRKQVADPELMKLIPDVKQRESLRFVSLDFEFHLKNVSHYEVAFPSESAEPTPHENETVLSILNPDVPGALPEKCRYVPCDLPILSSGYFTAYHSVYYFRLWSVKIGNIGAMKSIPGTHRTFVIHICVKDNDDSLTEDGLQLIYGHRLASSTLETSIVSTTVHGRLDFTLSNEIKIQLPANLHDKHHLFLTLYATYQRKDMPGAGIQRAYKVGYAAIPLTVKGVVQVKENWEMKFVSADQAVVVAAGGYLTKFPEAPVTAMLNGGQPVLVASSQTRSSVHASNRVIATFFKKMPVTIADVVENDDVLATPRMLLQLTAPISNEHHEVMTLMRTLPLAEILAFFPLLCSYSLSVICSPSKKVSLPVRGAMMTVLVGIACEAQQYDTTTSHPVKSKSGNPITSHEANLAKTTVASVLYHYLTNDLLYEGPGSKRKFRVYAGVAQVLQWVLAQVGEDGPESAEAEEPSSQGSPSGSPLTDGKQSTSRKSRQPPGQVLLQRYLECIWFLFDLITRSVYIWALENSNVSRGMLFDDEVYSTIGELCVTALDKLGVRGGSLLVHRVAFLVRNLLHHCDRGNVLLIIDQIMQYFRSKSNAEHSLLFLQLILDDADVLHLMMPSERHTQPVFLSKIIVSTIAPLVVHKVREVRVAAGSVLYNLLSRLSNNSGVPAHDLSCIAAQLLSLVRGCSQRWSAVRAAYDRGDDAAALTEKRHFIISLLWIVYYCPRSVMRAWLQREPEAKVLAGLMHMLTDAQVVFRSSGGAEKVDARSAESPSVEVAEWEARTAVFVTAIGSLMSSHFLADISNTLRTVKADSQSPAVFPFFLLVESLLQLSNCTLSLQMSTAVLHETVSALFPEIASRKGRMASGVVLLTFRMMSSLCRHVRNNVTSTFQLICHSYYSWTNSLGKIKALTANSLVAVAESKTRDLRLAGGFIEQQLERLQDRMKERGAPPSLPPDYLQRYEDESKAPSGDTGAENKYNVQELFTSVQRRIAVSPYLLSSGGGETAAKPSFQAEFEKMAPVMLSLFNDVVRLQVDDTMKFKESKIFAFFEVFRNFLRQNALKEVFRWLNRLHDAHKANKDYAEAGLVLVFIGALAFRITEVFFFVKGATSKGARIPYATLSHVFWHDYVRILPEVDSMVPIDTVYYMVSDLHVCPDDPYFTIEGQIKLLKEAAELLDKNQYYELSLQVISIVSKYLVAISGFKEAAVVHTAMSSWCNAIANNVGKRTNNRYFLLLARMEYEERRLAKWASSKVGESDMDAMSLSQSGELPKGLPNGKAIYRVYKQPPTTTLENFCEYAKSYVISLFGDESMVVLTDDMTKMDPSQPSLDSGARKKRGANSHKQPNRCLLTVCEVEPLLPQDAPTPPDGFDKTRHLQLFGHAVHLSKYVDPRSGTATGQRFDVSQHQVSYNEYFLDRAFPSTTTAIDIALRKVRLLNPFDTAKSTLEQASKRIGEEPEGEGLVHTLRIALSPMGIVPPGLYVKEVVAAMSSKPEVMLAVKHLTELVKRKLAVCDKYEAALKSPEDYALVLKAVTDIECAVVAHQV